MKTRIGFLALALAVGTASAAAGRARHMLVYSCNTDGTYTCADSCEVEPYNGKIGCCAKNLDEA